MYPALLATLVSLTMPPVEVNGNLVLPDDVYRTVLTLSTRTATITSTGPSGEETPPAWLALAERDPKGAEREVASLVLDFLLASGYELARVDARITPEGVVLNVDEGQLDRIIFLREGTFANIELRFALHLPDEIFNRPQLERLLADLVDGSDSILAAHWELVPTRPVEHTGLQVQDVRLIRGLRLLNPGSHHELRIQLERKVVREGLLLGLGFNGQDGIYGRIGYRTGSFMAAADRFEVDSRVGFYLGNGPESSKNPLGISRAQLMTRWSPVPLGFDEFRGYVHLEGNIHGRLRDDLEIANYYFAPLAGSVMFDAKFSDHWRLSIGGGIEQRYLFGVDTKDMQVALLDDTPTDEFRLFANIEIDWNIDPEELRADRQHMVRGRFRFLGDGSASGGGSIAKMLLEYDNTISIGFDELRYGMQAALQLGDVPFYDELSIGDGFLRTGFGTQVWTNTAAALSLEYRFSLSRDTLKLGLFNDFAIYDRLGPLRESVELSFADTFGVGLHVLLFDAFQINANVGMAYDQHLGFDLGLRLEVARAF